MFNYTPLPEETKSLSPLTYYQPFQSSFDPEFAAQSPKDFRKEFRVGEWGHGAERQTVNSHTWGTGGILSLWDQNRPGAYPQTWKTYPTASTSGWRGQDRHRPPLWSGHGPSHLLPTWGGDPKDIVKGLHTIPQRGPSFTTLDPSYCMRGVQSTPETTGHFLFGSNGKNAFKAGQSRPMMCNFCKNNKEVPDIYMNHYLYDPITKVLTCPVLRKHVCGICGGTGDRAHTLQYCPVNRERGLQAKVPVLLKTRTITNSTGKIRRN